MVAAKETKTRAGEARGALDRTFRGADLDEVEEVEDKTKVGGAIRGARGLAIDKLSPKEIINNMNDAVTSKLAVTKLAVQIEVTILWVRKEQSVLRNKLQGLAHMVEVS